LKSFGRQGASLWLAMKIAYGNGSGAAIDIKGWHPELLRLQQGLFIYCPTEVGLLSGVRKFKNGLLVHNGLINIPGD
jgi:hypothetical protein